MPSTNRIEAISPSPMRYGIYCLLSLLSVAVYQFVSYCPAHRALLFILGPPLTSYIMQVICICARRPVMAHVYCVPLTAVSVAMGHIAGLIQKECTNVAPNPWAQTCAIHFALSFFFLSECELYREYSEHVDEAFSSGEDCDDIDSTGTQILLCILEANTDPEFKHCRDAFLYDARPSRRPRRASFFEDFFSKRSAMGPLLISLYFAVNGCLNYPIKKVLNPNPKGENLFAVATGGDIFFTTDDTWLALLTWAVLLRPVRLANRMLFWAAVDATGFNGIIERKI